MWPAFTPSLTSAALRLPEYVQLFLSGHDHLFAVLAYVGLFYLASLSHEASVVACLVIVLTAIGLAAVNLSDDFQRVLEPGQSTWPYWLQTGLIAAYSATLVILTWRDHRA